MVDVATIEDDFPGTGTGTELQASRADQLASPMPWRQAPVLRQVVVLVALAVAISIGVAVALWSKDPNYTPLFSELMHDDVSKIGEALKSGDIPFRIDANTGGILVPSARVREVRMRLAAQGLPESSTTGLEILQEEQDLSTSQFIESARYNHALETELARSVSTLKNIKTARVHLALPKQSIFVRKRIKPTASVIVSLHPGRILERSQIAAIVHLVSSSIANMEAGQVTVVDQYGRLLTDADSNPGIALSAKQFEYRRSLERDYSERIVNLLEPIVGYGKVRAQVTAELNFSQVESTQEVFDPDQKDARQLVRSEQTSEEENRLDRALGIPGALTNQPPGEGTTDAEATANEDGGKPSSVSRAATRNYEIDRVISHQRKSSGDIQRLAVAVIVDDKQVAVTVPQPVKIGSADTSSADDVAVDDNADEPAEAGSDAVEGTDQAPVSTSGISMKRQPYTDLELERLTELVREVTGFSVARGDTIKVLNASFFEPEISDIPELPLWEQIWFQDLVKQVLGGIFILLLLLLIVRPIVRGLIPVDKEENVDDESEDKEDDDEDDVDEDDDSIEGELAEVEIIWGEDGRPIDPAADASMMQFDKKLNYARILVQEDPARAATMMKIWMNQAEEEKDAA